GAVPPPNSSFRPDDVVDYVRHPGEPIKCAPEHEQGDVEIEVAASREDGSCSFSWSRSRARSARSIRSSADCAKKSSASSRVWLELPTQAENQRQPLGVRSRISTQ